MSEEHKYFVFKGFIDNGENRPKRVYQLFHKIGDNPNLELVDEVLADDAAGCLRLELECKRLNDEDAALMAECEQSMIDLWRESDSMIRRGVADNSNSSSAAIDSDDMRDASNEWYFVYWENQLKIRENKLLGKQKGI